MEIIRHSALEKDFKNLRRFPAPRPSLESWELLFASKGMRETPGIEFYPGFGERKVCKARVVPIRENVGKSGGYRVIFELLNEQSIKILVFSRHGIYSNEKELVSIIKDRL